MIFPEGASKMYEKDAQCLTFRADVAARRVMPSVPAKRKPFRSGRARPQPRPVHGFQAFFGGLVKWILRVGIAIGVLYGVVRLIPFWVLPQVEGEWADDSGTVLRLDPPNGMSVVIPLRGVDYELGGRRFLFDFATPGERWKLQGVPVEGNEQQGVKVLYVEDLEEESHNLAEPPEPHAAIHYAARYRFEFPKTVHIATSPKGFFPLIPARWSERTRKRHGDNKWLRDKRVCA